MKKSTKIILIAALALVVAGFIITAVSIGNGTKVEVKREDGQPGIVNEFINTIVDNSVPAEGKNVTVSSSGDYAGKRWNDFSAEGVYEIPADGIDSIDIDWLAGGVEIKLTEGDKITLTESSKTELDEETALCWRIDGDELEIKYAARKDELPEKFLCVELPKTLAVRSAEVGSVSGYISIEGLRVEKKLDISGNSGSVKLVDCTAREMDIEAVSADITLESCAAAELETENVSGTISLGLDELPKKLSADNVSGDVYLRLPTDAAIDVEFDTVSGGFDSALACGLTKHSDYSVETVSGSLHIEAA